MTLTASHFLINPSTCSWVAWTFSESSLHFHLFAFLSCAELWMPVSSEQFVKTLYRLLNDHLHLERSWNVGFTACKAPPGNPKMLHTPSAVTRLHVGCLATSHLYNPLQHSAVIWPRFAIFFFCRFLGKKPIQSNEWICSNNHHIHLMTSAKKIIKPLLVTWAPWLLILSFYNWIYKW